MSLLYRNVYRNNLRIDQAERNQTAILTTLNVREFWDCIRFCGDLCGETVFLFKFFTTTRRRRKRAKHNRVKIFREIGET